MKNVELIYKIILIGDSGVGKTNILYRYTQNKFFLNHTITIGVDMGIKKEIINDEEIKVQLWDTAGQERFKSIIRSYFKNITACVFVYDITDFSSFVNLNKWLNEFKQNNTNNNPVIALVGNKCDLGNKRIISYKVGKEFAEKYNIDIFFETSAKSGNNINDVFLSIINKVIENNNNNVFKRNIIIDRSDNKYTCCI